MIATSSSVLTLGLGAWGGTDLLLTLGFGLGAAVIALPKPICYRPAVVDLGADDPRGRGIEGADDPRGRGTEASDDPRGAWDGCREF